ncbi:MAG: acetate--CoA ligase family protein, partial [Alphaproteobacteria bacterium]|nr:acetate--CoA ligase family protein [Alphaproteobacteria bacterium]
FYNDADGVWACGFPSPRDRQAGGSTLISPSGSAWGALAHNDARFRFNLVVSPGQEIATTAADYLEYALDLESTKVVGLFIETVRDPLGFVRALDKAARKGIPVVVLKVGRSERGAALALSHSGAIAGHDGAYQALFDRYGVIQVDTLDELGASLLLFAAGRRAANGGVAVVHDSGGEREMAVDLAEQHAMPYAQINDATRARLAARLDPGLEPGNPLDAWGTGKDYVQIFEECTKALLDDPDTAMAMLCADIRDGYYLHDGYVEAMTAVVGKTAKPLAVATNYTQVRHEGIAQRLTLAGIPVLDGTLNAMRAAKAMLAHRDFLARQADAPPPVPAALTAAKRETWRKRLREGRPLAESEALDLLRDYGVPATPYRLVGGPEEASQAAAALGFPVALKTAMPEILHKSDVGGVALGLADAAAVRAAYADMAKRLGPKALVAPMAPSGTELALGVINDGQFGPVVMVAAGGILVELLRDAAHGLAPFGTATAQRLIGKLRAAKLLAGVRGRKPADVTALADAVARLSVLAQDLGDLIAEIDVNPVIAGPAGIVAVDALVVPRKP